MYPMPAPQNRALTTIGFGKKQIYHFLQRSKFLPLFVVLGARKRRSEIAVLQVYGGERGIRTLGGV